MSNFVEQWSTRWSEHNSPFKSEFIREPINTLTAGLMFLFVLFDLKHQLCHYIKARNSKKNGKIRLNYYKLFMKSLLAGNLFTSLIAHSSYNRYAIILDSGSIMVLITIFMIREGRWLESLYLVVIYLHNDTVAYLLAFISVSNIIGKIRVNDYKVRRDTSRYIVVFFVALVFWMYDQQFKEQWYIYGHAIFHILSVYSINELIQIYC